MKKIIELLKRKKIITYGIVFIIAFTLIGLFSKKEQETTPGTTIVTSRQESPLYTKTSKTTVNETLLKELEKDVGVYQTPSYPSIEVAEETVYQLGAWLPIYIEEFDTSVGITTTILMSSKSTNPRHVLDLEIFNIDYHNRDLNETTNPNVTAFKESFYKALSEIEKHGIDPRNMYYRFGGRDYIRETSEYWVKELKLLDY